MTFNSIEFLIFYPVVALLYFLLPRKCVWPMLLVASYYFYMCYQAELVVLIAGTTLISWLASRAIYNSRSAAVKRLWLTVTLVVCFGVLFFYKYFNFISGTVTGLIGLLGGEVGSFELDLLLPVGISFYTFQTLSYVIDVYRGDVLPERNFFFYALFVSFFPQLVAGPIERPGNLIPQLRQRNPWSGENAVKGAKHMLVGFFKKICVADIIAVYVNAVYNDVAGASGLGIVIATVLFAIQIYCDFSGYTDIAIGCARIMGIRLMKNFDHPYMATSIKEFWSRWHISLSGWFKDYLYIPLGGNRCARPRALFNVFVVFLVSGLWHGASWTFVIWGALHGFYQIVGNLTKKLRDKMYPVVLGRETSERTVVWWRRICTFVLVSFAWIFFRANTVEDSLVIMDKLFVSGWGEGVLTTFTDMGLDLVGAITAALAIGTLILIDRMLTYDDSPDSSGVLVSRGASVYFVWAIILCWLLLLSGDMVSSFIYFQF